ncbi:hypothetical protein [Salmonella enterica]|uniref:Uncharacterized protein n=1 Tax=Salmonella enterica subsp. enterica serovar Karamoja TaxID=2500153 RepID=A0A3T0CIF8_SALET|nr:hypothetical protein [Salmonella enterica]AZT44443.1 hypothetical protein EL007_24640 [Salmonella enterica subsp. enterica serovar Karamoja]
MHTDTTEQNRFFTLLSQYPRIAVFWSRAEGECKTEALRQAMGGMSHGEAVLARFFLSLWNGSNAGFDLVEAAGLDDRERQLIARWLADPFWP